MSDNQSEETSNIEQRSSGKRPADPPVEETPYKRFCIDSEEDKLKVVIAWGDGQMQTNW